MTSRLLIRSWTKPSKLKRTCWPSWEKIADELNTIFTANLEGSTLVKRLKAASRTQYLVAGRITEQLDETFGLRNTRLEDAAAAVLKDMSKKEEESVQEISYIMDDLAGLFRTSPLCSIQGSLGRHEADRRHRWHSPIDG